MPDRPYVIDQMISAKAIAARVEALAREITTHFHGTDKLVVVGLLRGSFVFIADLVREIELPVEVDFLEASSYGDAMHSSREVRILKDLRGEIAGRDNELNALREQLGGKDGELGDLRAQLASKDDELNGLRGEVENLRAQATAGAVGVAGVAASANREEIVVRSAAEASQSKRMYSEPLKT